MIKDVDLLFDLDDVGLIPQGTSEPFSISECSLMTNNKLPIFVFSNDIGPRDDITYIIRKEEPLEKRLSLMYSTFVSMDFEDFYKYIVNNETKVKISDETFYINIDIADVGIKRLIDVIKAAKKKYNDQLILIANRVTYIEQYNTLNDLRVNYVIIGNTDEHGNKIPSVDGFVTPYGYLIELINSNLQKIDFELDHPGRDRPRFIPRHVVQEHLGIPGENVELDAEEDEDEILAAPRIPCEPIYFPYVGEKTDRIIKAMALGCRYVSLYDEVYVDKVCDILISAIYKGRCKNLKEFRNTKAAMISQAVLNSN